MTDDLDPTTAAAPDPSTGAAGGGEGAERPAHRSGFVALVGRPNVGKSTLTNALVGEKVAITSSKPQTTRRAIRGIVTGEDSQIILVDTPGVHRPRTLLGERLNDLVRETLGEVDVVGFCLPADQKVGPGDRFICEDLVEMRTGRRGPRVVAIVTKTDLVSRDRLAEHLMAVDQMMDFDEIVPISAVRGDQIDVLLEVIAKQLPEGPQLYPDDQLTEESATIGSRSSSGRPRSRASARSSRTRSPWSSRRSWRRIPTTRSPTSPPAKGGSWCGRRCSSNATARRASSSARAVPASRRSGRGPVPRSIT